MRWSISCYWSALASRRGGFFMLGDAKITVSGTLALEPDRLSGRLNFGPRVLMSRARLSKIPDWCNPAASFVIRRVCG